MTVYTSTGGYGQWPAYLSAGKLADAGVRAIELSGGRPAPDLVDRLAVLRDRVSFEVHNYFPPPPEPFVLKLGSLDHSTAERSVEHVRSALKACAALGSNHYSFHAGFLIDPRVDELGKRIRSRALFDRDACVEAFVSRVRDLAQEAARAGVRLMIENNVLSSRNATEFGGNPLLMCDPVECRQIMQRMPENVGLLVDVAHLKVSAKSLGFDPASMFEECESWIVAYHLSDNDGLEDSNQVFDEQSWFWPHLKKNVQYYSIEVYGLAPADMPRLVNLCNSKLERSA